MSDPAGTASEECAGRSVRVPRTGLRAIRERALRAVEADPDVMLFAAQVSVWMRWLVGLAAVLALAYRPELWFGAHKEYLVLLAPLVGVNGFVHYRLRKERAMSWRWLLLLSAMDITLITAAVIIGGEFHLFVYVAYYPALALFAVVFTSLWLSLTWTTVVAASYAVVSLTLSSGLDIDAGQEKALRARLAAMYAVVGCVSLIARFERIRRQESAERELHRERIELSQATHDTAAQTAYMIGLGIHRAMKPAGDSNEELTATLAATSSLSKTAMWELRRPSTRVTSSRGGSWAACSGRTRRHSRRLHRSPPRWCSPGPSRLFPWRPGLASSPSPTTRSPTHFCTPTPAGSKLGWTSRPMASGCPSRTTGSACPTTMPTAAAASGACGRTPSNWVAGSSWRRADGARGRR